MPETTIHPETSLGYVHLTVADLDTQLAFYQEVLGFQLHWRDGDTAALGAGKSDLLRLTERRGARRVLRTTGLYHFAVLVPARVDLAQLLRRIAETRTPVQGIVDHRINEAIYLPDPEGNGIELNWDRPRQQWPSWDTVLRLGNAPLDVDGLMAELAGATGAWTGLHPDTAIGHVHLHVPDIEAARAFYHDVLGFDDIGQYHGQAGFVSAGGYHHHIGYNTWAGVGAPPPPPESIGLRYFVIHLPVSAELTYAADRVRRAGLALTEMPEGLLLRDPSQNAVLLTAAGSEESSVREAATANPASRG